MTLTFDQTEQDFIDFIFYHSWQRPERRWTRIFNRFLPLVFFTAMALTDYKRSILIGILLVCIAILWSILTTPYFRWRMKGRVNRMIKSGKNADLTGTRTIEFTEEGLIASTKNSRSEIRWDGVEYLRETDKHLFLIITVSSAILFPKRIFSSMDEMESFKSFINKNITTQNTK